MARVSLVDPTEANNEIVREFADRVSRSDGAFPAHFAAEAHFPAVMKHVYEARLAIARDGDLGPLLFSKLAVAISMANECTYCTGAYATQLSARLGSDGAAREFQLALAEGELDDGEAAVIDAALALLAAPASLTDEDFDRLRAELDFSDRTFVELVYVVNVVSGYNRLTMAFDLPYDHAYPEEWADPASLPRPVGGDRRA